MTDEILVATNSATMVQIAPIIKNGLFGLVAVIASAFFGGLFAGVWTNYFETKRRIHDKDTTSTTNTEILLSK